MTGKEGTEQRDFKPGVYKHFKGGMYLALILAKDSETLDDFVVYIPLYDKPESGTRAWIRPLNDFMGSKELEDGTTVKRFEFISDR